MKRRACLFTLSSLALAGCSSVSVSRDYDVNAGFSNLKTFAWKHAEQPQTGNPRMDNDLIDERVRAAVNAELQRKGFVAVDKDYADFFVAYFIDYKQRINSSSVSLGAGGGSYGRYGCVGYDSGISDYEEGYLTIDIINPASDKNFWRGVGRRTSYDGNNPKKVTKIVHSAVLKILKTFPPKK